MRRRRRPGLRGFAFLEALVALMLFAIAMAGLARSQLSALSATREAIAYLRATRLLRDLAQREGAGTMSSMVLSLEAGSAPSGLPPAVIAWVRHAASDGAGLGPARLCIESAGTVLELSLVWGQAAIGPNPGCPQTTARASVVTVLR
jgi:hypothetical protein